MRFKNAFTLAEVLITIGVIGIVAALTISILIKNYQKTVLRQQFKKSYNTVLNAFNQVESQLGYKPVCYYEYVEGESNPYMRNSDCQVLSDSLSQILKVIKVCNGNGVRKGCIPPYKGIDTIYKAEHEDASDEDIYEMFRGALVWHENSIQTRNTIWVLSDGSIIIWGDAGAASKLFALDINGKKSPNKWGYDIFPFIVVSDSSKPFLLKSNSNWLIEKGGVSTLQMMREVGL